MRFQWLLIRPRSSHILGGDLQKEIHVSLFKNLLLLPAISNTIFPNYSYLYTRLLLSSDGEGGGGVAD